MKEQNKIIFGSWKKILDKEIKDKEKFTFENKLFQSEDFLTPEGLKEAKKSIRSLSSKIDLNDIKRVVGSNLEGHNYKIYDYTKLGDKPLISNPFFPQVIMAKFNENPFLDFLNNQLIQNEYEEGDFDKNVLLKNLERSEFVENHTLRYLHKPFPLFNDENTTLDINELMIDEMLFHNSSKDIMSQNCTLYGDINLKPAQKIILNVPKQKEEVVDGADRVDESALDEILSGEYIIFTSVHTFKNGEYTTGLNLNKLAKPVDKVKYAKNIGKEAAKALSNVGGILGAVGKFISRN